MAEKKQGLTSQQEANRQRDGKFGAFGHSDKNLPELGGRLLVPAGASDGGNYVPRGAASAVASAGQDYSGSKHPAGTSLGGLPTWMGQGPRTVRPALDQESQALLDSDLGAILEDTSLDENDKARFQDMAEQLSRYGTVDMAANGPRAIRFGRGSKYGGDRVPHRFRSFHAKAEGDAARRSEATKSVVSAAAKAVQENPAAVKKSRFDRLFGR